MNGLAGSVSPAGPLYVRALYDYAADDSTSLSFHTGDVIQVITQLESGWWDGVLDGVRGWFPSNYCAVVTAPFDDGTGRGVGTDSETEDSEDEYGEHEVESAAGANGMVGGTSGSISGSHESSAIADGNEEAAFWIPQATPAGKLFFFNTLTGESSSNLPLRAPSSANEAGPRDRTNVYIPDQTRPPAELMAAGYEIDDDTDYTSASEAEELSIAQTSKVSSHRRRSYSSENESPATSTDSLNKHSPSAHSRANLASAANASLAAMQQGIPPIGTTMNSFANVTVPNLNGSFMSRRLFDDASSTPLTWNAMVDDMRRAVGMYREVITNGERSEYVRKAEDISDHLRQLLAAGSGTTDNHSGAPSIISKNKTLYPHFREMMSRFSKLVLSSHIAATDWPAPDSSDKCLQEADCMLQGVYAFVDVARQQRGEEIARITPGFVMSSRTAGNWQNNGLVARDPLGTNLFVDDDQDILLDPSATLDAALLARIEDLKRLIVSGIRRLEEHLTIRDKLITPRRQQEIVNAVCKAATQVVEVCRPFFSAVESINLAPIGTHFTTHQLSDFTEEKQRLYDNVSDLIISCQAVGSPLGDEWAEVRGPSLDDRLQRCRVVGQQLETTALQIFFSLQLLSNVMPPDKDGERDPHRLTDPGAPYHNQLRPSSTDGRPQMLGDIGHSKSYTEGQSDHSADIMRNKDSSKVQRFFGEVPASITIPTRESEEVPKYLQLDHESEMSYDYKVDPPMLRGGTLTGLVEHLTRHDKLDSGFNNTFLLTYQSFTTAPELFEMLVKRWSIQPPPGLADTDLKTWKEMKQALIRLRVMNILKAWIEHYWLEPEGEASDAVLNRINGFVTDTMVPWNERARVVTKLIQTKLNKQEVPSRKLVPNTSFHAPAPIIPKNMKKLKFLDIDSLEFARQLTIVESTLHGKVKPAECLNKTWQKKPKEGEKEKAENVKSLILHSNQLTNWVAQMILTQADVKRRVVVIKHFVAIADKCRSLNNFSCLTAIISALDSAPIHRLNRTWAQVNARTTTTLASMRQLMGATKNFMEYREALHRANPPCIPFFGIYLTDLVFIEDGIPSLIKKTQYINFLKRAKTAEVIRNIQQYQNVPYALQSVPELQDYILRNMHTAGDVREMYERSLTVEPRERDDEKIARLLSESGFL